MRTALLTNSASPAVSRQITIAYGDNLVKIALVSELEWLIAYQFPLAEPVAHVSILSQQRDPAGIHEPRMDQDSPIKIGRKVAYLHLHKTGGTTVINVLQQMLPQQSFAVRDTLGRVNFKGQQLDSAHVIAGHFTAADLAAAGAGFATTTVMREPVARLLSHYYFHKSHTLKHLIAYDNPFLWKVKHTPLRELIRDAEFGAYHGNYYLRRLDPEYDAHLPTSLPSFTRAKDWLEGCFLVGTTEKIEVYCHALASALGVQSISNIPQLNNTRSNVETGTLEHVETEQLSAADIEQIDQIIGEDKSLYDHFSQYL